MHLRARKMSEAILDDATDESQKVKTLIFIWKHMVEALQIAFMAEEDPKSLWEALVDRFDHKKLIFFALSK